MFNFKSQAGFGLLEVALVVSILSILSVGVILVLGNLTALGNETLRSLAGAVLIEETAEVLRLWRDERWSNLSSLAVGADYYLAFDGNNFATGTTPILTDGIFDRHFRVADVYRDINDDIVLSGGTLDPDTRRFNLTVAWLSRQATTTRELSLILANIFND